MKNHDLDTLLRSYAGTPVPSLPGSFAQDVLREIRLRSAPSPQGAGWLQELTALFLRPAVLAAGFAVALTVGLASPAMVALRADSSLAAAGLGLDVFSSAAPHVPSGLLSRAP